MLSGFIIGTKGIATTLPSNSPVLVQSLKAWGLMCSGRVGEECRSVSSAALHLLRAGSSVTALLLAVCFFPAQVSGAWPLQSWSTEDCLVSPDLAGRQMPIQPRMLSPSSLCIYTESLDGTSLLYALVLMYSGPSACKQAKS